MSSDCAKTDFTPIENRRKASRFNCASMVCSCTITSDHAAESSTERRYSALLVNIGTDGLCVESSLQPVEGACIGLEARPIEGPEVRMKVRVLHSRPSSRTGFRLIGAEIDDISDSYRQNLVALLNTIARFEEGLSQA